MLMNDDAEQAEPGADGLVFLPYMMGERSPVWDPYARGIFFGLSLKTTRREMNRAVLEGCAYGLRQLIEMVEEVTGEKLTHFSSIGGGAKEQSVGSDQGRHHRAGTYGTGHERYGSRRSSFAGRCGCQESSRMCMRPLQK